MIPLLKMRNSTAEKRAEKEFLKVIDEDYSGLTNLYDYTVDYKKKILNDKHLVGEHYIPNEKTSKGVIVTFGGSEGSNGGDRAHYLANRGYEVLALYYFGEKNVSKTLSEIPLEFFADVLDYIEEDEALTILGSSRGAELGLLLSSYYDEIDNLVLYSPSAYVFPGNSFGEETYAWTYDGVGLPYVDSNNISSFVFMKLKLAEFLNAPFENRIFFDSALKNTENLEDYRIKAENTSAEILVFSGTDDGIWNSSGMARLIEEHGSNVTVYDYKNAGHVFLAQRVYEGILIGGNPRDNLEAYIDSNKILLENLAKWHK